MANVTIYTKDHCPYCVKAKELFQARNIAFEEVRIDLNPDKLEEMLRLSNNKRTVPQIFINQQSIGGYDDLAKIIKAGKFDELINQ